MNERLTFARWLANSIARWRFVLGFTSVVVVLVAVISLLVTPAYRAVASFVTAGSGIQLPAGLAGVAAQLGVLPTEEPDESPMFYSELLQSRELLTRLATSMFDDPRIPEAATPRSLVDILVKRSKSEADAIEKAIRRLRRTTQVIPDQRTNLVTIVVDSRWADLSAAIANRAVELVALFNLEQRQSRARELRRFLEARVAEGLHDLEAAENEFQVFYQQNRLWQDSPPLLLEEGRLRRRVSLANQLYIELRSEFETAKIEAVNDTPVITIVDSAVPQVRRRFPRRTQMVVVAGFVGMALGMFTAGVLELLGQWSRENPDDSESLQRAIRGMLRGLTPRLRRRHPDA
jgi:uncharacterized protein involved in exopolysaccharide biosynthesis